MPPEIVPEDDEYLSSEDSDFAPDAPQASDVESNSESEDWEPSTKTTTHGKPKSTKRKRAPDDEAEDAGFENSGDEAIIEKGLKKQRKREKKGLHGPESDDEGGEGGLIKTRSMRALMKVERKPLADTTAATVDVDALWASMISGKPQATELDTAPAADANSVIEQKSLSPADTRSNGQISHNGRKESRSQSTLSDGPDSMIMIKRTYNFAGKVHTEEKLVPRNSAEAKLYLSSKDSSNHSIEEPSSPFRKPKRPPKRARRSIFEPVAEVVYQRNDLNFGVRKDDGVGIGAAGAKDAKKLNTVEKSAMDWAGFVDKEGIKDELDAAGKAKGAFRERQQFLARVDEKREEEVRKARGI